MNAYTYRNTHLDAHHTYTHTHAHSYTRIYTYTCPHVHTYENTYTFTHTLSYTDEIMLTYSHTHAHIHMCAYTLTCTISHVYTHTPIHFSYIHLWTLYTDLNTFMLQILTMVLTLFQKALYLPSHCQSPPLCGF